MTIIFNNVMRVRRGAIALGIFFIIGIPLATHAVNTPSSVCNFESQLKRLDTLEKETAIAPETQNDAALTLRKTILKNVIACDTKEIETLRTALHTLTISAYDIELSDVVLRFEDNIDSSLLFYDSRNEALKNADIETTKIIARELYAHRKKVIAPLLEYVAQFIFWIDNQTILRSAEERFADINTAIYAQKLLTRQDVEILFKQSRTNLYNAQVSNRRARQLFIENQGIVDAPYFIKSSLESLSKAYQSFFDLGRLLNTILSK